jgi:hypothetical protein
MKKVLFYFALTGWTSSLIVHLLSLADIDVSETIPFVWFLHIGIFVVWFPVVFELKKNEELQAYQQSGILNKMNQIGLLKIIFKDTPTWIIIIVAGGFFYAIINFIINFMLSMSLQGGTPEIKDGVFILESHGKLIRTLTEQEYNHYKANTVRIFSGHWILFYGVATAILFKFSGLTKQKP